MNLSTRKDMGWEFASATNTLTDMGVFGSPVKTCV